jgi:hypothetical protein
MNIKDLWIGDLVNVLDLNKIGTFEGMSGDKVKIKIENSTMVFAADRLGPYLPKEVMPELIFNDEKLITKSEKKQKTFTREIDLHIEKLNPAFMTTVAENVLDYQLKSCEQFIKDAIENKLYKVTIIHGKGEGKLRELVHSMLSSFIEVKMKILTNKDGATEVWLSY